MKTLAVAIAANTAIFASQSDAHTYVKQPLTEFKKGTTYPSSWVDEFPPPWQGTFRTGAQYTAAAKEKGFKNLRAFLEDKGPVCGNSLPDAKPKPIPTDGLIKFASSMEHPGPCEVWFDDTLAFHDDDCEKTFGSATQFKIDYSLCKGSCMLRFYWLGLQASGTRWQSYKNCVPLGSGKASSNKPKAGGETSGNEADTVLSTVRPVAASTNATATKCKSKASRK